MYVEARFSLPLLKITPLWETLVRALSLDFLLVTTGWFLPTVTVPIFARHSLWLSMWRPMFLFWFTPGCGRQRSRGGPAAVDHGRGGYGLPIRRPGRGGLRQGQGPRPLADVARRQMPPPQVRHHEYFGCWVVYYWSLVVFWYDSVPVWLLYISIFLYRIASDEMQVLWRRPRRLSMGLFLGAPSQP